MLNEILRLDKEHIQPTIRALQDFKDAYFKLLYIWYSNDILDHTESLGLYPFHRSFDELNVAEWVDATIEEIRDLVSLNTGKEED